MYTNNYQQNLALLRACDYQGMIQCLEETYCFCPTSEARVRSWDHCKCEDAGKPQKFQPSGPIIDLKTGTSKMDNGGSLEPQDMIFRISRCHSENQSSNNNNGNSEKKEEAKNVKRIYKRRNRSTKLNIRERLVRLQKLILTENISGFSSQVKKTRYTTNKYLGRRSKYIGVSKNNTNWQALINVNHAKKYIGTFVDEVEAARTYDLYSVAMQDEKAFLNFSYTASEMLEMISYYLSYGSIKPLQ